MDAMLGSVFEEEPPWATWPLPCPLGICATSPVSKALSGHGSMGEWGRGHLLECDFPVMP